MPKGPKEPQLQLLRRLQLPKAKAVGLLGPAGGAVRGELRLHSIKAIEAVSSQLVDVYV